MDIQTLYQKAIDFAGFVHKEQKVPGKPYSYIVHVSNVAMELLVATTYIKIENLSLAVQCALLHDTLEDTETEFQEIVQKFGIDVASGVLALTKSKDLDKKQAMEDSINRILKQPTEIGMVKLADRICNLQPPPHYWTEQKIANYREEALYIWTHLNHCHSYLSERLKNKI